MAHFRGSVRGSRGEASRLGGKAQGLEALANGWDSGVRVVAHVDSSGVDCFAVYMTKGSNDPNMDSYLGEVRGREWIPAPGKGR